MPGAVNLAEIMLTLRRRMPPETIVTNDAGNFAIWVHRFYRYTGFRTQLAPTSGAMGYGVPSAVAAKLVHPERPVLAFCGAGGDRARPRAGRVGVRGLRYPDVAALARAYGAHGECVSGNAAFEPALERALDSGKPALIEIRIDPEAIPPRATLSGIRAEASK